MSLTRAASQICFCYDKAECPYANQDNFTKCKSSFKSPSKFRGFTQFEIDCKTYPHEVAHYMRLFFIAAVIQSVIVFLFCCACYKSNDMREHPYFKRTIYRNNDEAVNGMAYTLHEPQKMQTSIAVSEAALEMKGLRSSPDGNLLPRSSSARVIGS